MRCTGVNNFDRPLRRCIAVVGLLLLSGLQAGAQTPADASKTAALPTTAPAALPARTQLEEVNRETQELYRSLQGSVLRVQMPSPKWVNDLAARDRDAHFDRYKLNPAVKQQLLEQQRAPLNQAQTQQSAPPPQGPTTQPAELAPSQPGSQHPGRDYPPARPSSVNDIDPPAHGNRADSAPADASATTRQGVVIVVPPANYNNVSNSNYPTNAANIDNNVFTPSTDPTNDARPNDRQPDLLTGNARLQLAGRNASNTTNGTVTNGVNAAVFAPNNLGLLLDDRGHVLVPLYVEREAVGDQPIRLVGADGEPADARYVGADQQTNLTVLQLIHPVGKPVKLSKAKLPDGSLVLYLSPVDGSGRLGLWNGGAGGNRDSGVVVSIDGQVAGIARFGQFLSGSACQLIADQIIRHGSVRRATLGVIITQVDPDDPARRDQPLLGERPAVRVDQVMKGSAADQAGLKVGDVVLAVAGDAEACKDIPTIAAAVAARDGKTPLRVLRGGEMLDLTVDLHSK